MEAVARVKPPENAPLRQAYAAGRREHPRVELPFEDFVEFGRDRPPRAAADYYLARACNAGLAGSWERLQARFQRPLRAFLRKRGAARGEADQLLDETWGALAAPPPRGGAATRIGTYDGRGSLYAWLATVVWRRLTDRWRARATTTDAAVAEHHAAPEHRDPAVRVAQSETAERLGAALEDAWSGLTRRELQAVVLKYCHRLPQTEIASAMNVSPPRVTRLLQSAMTRLRATIESKFETHPDWSTSGGGWSSLFETVERMLARTAAAMDTPGAGRHTHG